MHCPTPPAAARRHACPPRTPAPQRTRALAAALVGSLALLGVASSAQAEGFRGEVGLGLFGTQAQSRLAEDKRSLLPYLWGDWGPAYARLDTFGLKLLPLGAGHLELAARVSQDGFTPGAGTPGIGARRDPLPLGLGSFQRTEWGGLFLYALHDLRSGGQLAEATWAGRFALGPSTLYPMAALEYRSAALVNHLAGVSAAEAAASGLPAYQGRAVWQPRLGLTAQWPLGAGAWSLLAQGRHTWLGAGMRDSPLIQRRGVNSAFLALTYRFD